MDHCTTQTDDTISRHMAIEAINTWDKFGVDERGRLVRWHGGLELYVRLRDVLTVIVNLQSVQSEQWIPCSERLPEEEDVEILKKHGISKMSKIVLATVEVKGERMTVTACTYDGEWDWNMKYAFPDYKIIAWMPLPEPYKGEQR